MIRRPPAPNDDRGFIDPRRAAVTVAFPAAGCRPPVTGTQPFPFPEQSVGKPGETMRQAEAQPRNVRDAGDDARLGHVPPGDPDPHPARKGEIPLSERLPMRVDRPRAQREKYLFHFFCVEGHGEGKIAPAERVRGRSPAPQMHLFRLRRHLPEPCTIQSRDCKSCIVTSWIGFFDKTP